MRKIHSLAKLMLTCSLCLIIIGLVILRQDDIITILNSRFFKGNTKVVIETKNDYYRDYDFEFVQNVNNITPSSYQDLLNIYYSFLNSGEVSFTFTCPSSYETCVQDVQKIAHDEEIVSSINNYVHPYNSFAHIKTEFYSLGKIVISIVKNYTNEQIQMINEKVDELYPKLVYSDNPEDNIRRVHDYIINNVKYDSLRSDQDLTTYQSDIAYGPLFEGYAICGGYTDLMQLFLEKMNLKSFRISSNNHIWNAVNIGNTWYHLDLTWDDPVVSDGSNYLEHTYFLVSTKQLKKLEKVQHDYNPLYYPEIKES